MKTLARYIGYSVIALSLIAAPLFPNTAIALAVPKVIAVFTTSLQASISSTDTALTLVSGTDKAGNAISGYTCFVIDEGTSLEEFVCGTASSTSVTGLVRGIDPVNPATSVTALKKAHRRGGSVKITNYPVEAVLARILNGDATIPNPIAYDSSIATSSLYSGGYNLVSVNMLADSVAAGCVNASETSRGCGELATVAELAAGTSLGSTGARLVAPGSAFSSTTSATNLVPVTNASGKIASGFIATSSDYLWTGVNTWSASSTHSGTTTFTGGVIIASTSTLPITRSYVATTTSAVTSTWTKPSNLRYLLVRLVGGGGGGGGDDTSQRGAGAGGGGGGYCEQIIPAASLPATVTTTAGAAGLHGSGGGSGTNGGLGGTTSFNGFCAATGGSGGRTNDSPNIAGGGGGIGSSGDLNIAGGGGTSGWDDSGSDSTTIGGGAGGSSRLGGGAAGSSNSDGTAGGVYGGGGSGGSNSSVGGDGAPGAIFVTEYYI